MATVTLGTTLTSSLTALRSIGGYGSGMAPADIAAIAALIKDDIITSHPLVSGAFSANGILYVPNRGSLKILPGDYIGVDSAGFPILVPANSIANAAWTHT